VSAMDTSGHGLGSDGLPWANARAREMCRVYGLSPERKGIGFFFTFEFIFNAKTIPEKSRNCLKA
jgi:hypothetical protein